MRFGGWLEVGQTETHVIFSLRVLSSICSASSCKRETITSHPNSVFEPLGTPTDAVLDPLRRVRLLPRPGFLPLHSL